MSGIVAFAIVLFQYGGNKQLKANRWFAFFRFVTFFSLLVLLINPQFIQHKYYLEKPVLALVVDNSASIQNIKKGKAVKDFVAHLRKNPKLKKRFSIHTYQFGKRFKRGDSLSFSEEQTKLAFAFDRLSELYNTQDLTAPLVVVTDGNQTFGPDYTYAARNYPHPVFPVVVGDTAQFVDLQIGQLNTNRYVFSHHRFPVEIFLHYKGTKKVNTQLKIKHGQKVIFTKNLVFSPQNKTRILTPVLSAKQIGVQVYLVSLAALDTEKNKRNNHKKFAVEVIDQKTKILLVPGVLHPDIGAFKKAIETNKQRSVEIKSVDDITKISQYQLVVLYQPNSTFETLYSKLKKVSMPTMTITGTGTDYRFLNQVQKDFSKQISGQKEEYLPLFNTNYSVFQAENIGFDDFPPLQDMFGNIEFKTKVSPILFQTINGFRTKTPLLFTLHENNNSRAYLFGEGLWKWRAKVYRNQKSFEIFDNFIGKLAHYLTADVKRSRLLIDYDSFYKEGEPVRIKAKYFDANYVFDPDERLYLLVRKDKAEKSVQRPFLLKNNYFQIDLSDFSEGKYHFSVFNADKTQKKTGVFTIVDFEVEAQFVNANLDKLQSIATNKKTAVYFLNNPQVLIDDLMHNKTFRPIQKSKEVRSSLIEWYYLLGLIVLSLSAEWFLRKYRGKI